LEKATSKDEEINHKLEILKNLALQKSLDVSINKKFADMKKKFH
jgi:hypothetical protein